MRNLTLILMALLATALASPVYGDSRSRGIDLAPKFEPGQTHRLDYSIRSTQKMSAFGNDQTTESEMNARIELEVLDEEPADAAHVVALTYRRLSISFTGGQVPGAFDSQNLPSTDPGNIYAEICRPMLNEQIRLIVDERGNITSVEGIDKLAPDGLAGVLFSQLFSEDAVKAMFQPVLKILDDGESTQRGVGEEWTVKRPAVQSLGVPESEVSLSVLRADEDRDVAQISISGKTTPMMPGDASVLPNIETKKAELSGRLEWNTGLGILESLETEAVSHMVSSAQGISISVESSSATRIKRIR